MALARALMLVVPALLVAGASRAQPGPDDIVVVATEAAGILPLRGETRLLVHGLRGEVRVRPGAAEQLRFRSSARDDRNVALPVALSRRSNTLLLTAAAEPAAAERELELAVPPGLVVRLELEHTKISAGGLDQSLEIAGRDLDVRLYEVSGTVEVDLDRGGFHASRVRGDFDLEGSELTVKLEAMAGPVYLSLSDSEVQLLKLEHSAELDLEGGSLTVAEARAPLRVRARGGTARLVGLAKGGELRLEDVPLVIRDSEGDVTVETDAEVVFEANKIALHVDSYGGPVRGIDNTGLVEIKSNGAPVTLQRIAGPTRVAGDGLEVALEEISGEVLVYATSSDIEIVRAGPEVIVESEFGERVRVLELSGRADVRAHARHVEVDWREFSKDKDSLIRNEGGDVTVRFQGRGGCRIDAETRFGRIVADMPQVRISESGNHASGLVGRSRRPVVRVVAAGDILLTNKRASKEGS